MGKGAGLLSSVSLVDYHSIREKSPDSIVKESHALVFSLSELLESVSYSCTYACLHCVLCISHCYVHYIVSSALTGIFIKIFGFKHSLHYDDELEG